jgi:hypothetical protein
MMVAVRWSRLGLCAAALISAAPFPAMAQAPVAPHVIDRYAVGAVKTDFKPSRRIGSKRAGLVCLPAGTFKWSDARAGMGDARATIADVLREQAPAVVDAADDPFSDERGATRYKIVATVQDFKLDACVRNWGLAARFAHRQPLSGHGHVEVMWDVFDRTTRASIAHSTIASDFDLPRDVEDAAAALTAGLKLNAGQFARGQWPVRTAGSSQARADFSPRLR